jgi:Protein of unknown function (DUF1064)
VSRIPIRLDSKSKYRAKRTNGFASKKESARYDELCLMQKAGLIAELKTQVRFIFTIGGIDICTYVADFTYIDLASGKKIVEDVKGYRTNVYKIKARLMLAVHGIEILES